MTRKRLKILFAIIIIVILFGVYWMSTFDILPVEEKLVSRFEDHSGKVMYEIFIISGNATTNDAIQLKRVEKVNSTVVATIADFNAVESFRVLNDSSLQLSIKNTFVESNEPETFIVNLINGRTRQIYSE
jgi:hypothetical protein